MIFVGGTVAVNIIYEAPEVHPPTVLYAILAENVPLVVLNK